LGGILYSLLTLAPPVDGASLQDILSKVRSGTIVPPTDFNAPSSSTKQSKTATPDAPVAPKKIYPLSHCPGGKVPWALSAVTMKGCCGEKPRRYQRVAELAADIAAYQGGFATSAENAGALTQIRLLVRRHKVLVISALVVVVLSLGFMAKVIASQRLAEQR